MSGASDGSQVDRRRRVRGVEVPTFLYGTAWKEERTEGLVTAALDAGFRGVDTANQRRHYHEAAVGAAVRSALDDGSLHRQELFLQTKFTHVEGQDHRLPYDRDADLPTQVHQSFASSLEHLEVDRLDSYVLHSPHARHGLDEGDRQVWRAFEELHDRGRVRLLGVSNVSADQLSELCDLAEVPPAFVQNRCFARLGWDRAVRDVCRERGVVYQGFSLLTANAAELHRPEVEAIARRHGRSVPQVVFRFAHQLGTIPLTGTTDPEHMRQDLAVYDFEISPAEVDTLEGIGER